MKAIVWAKYGAPEGLQLEEIEKPSPGENEILVKIHATTVTAGDSEIRRLKLPLMLSFPFRLYVGLLKPKRIRILGQEFAGEVVEVGNGVASFAKGDQVFGTTGFSFGAYAEYICLQGNHDEMNGALAIKPANMSYEEAAAVPTAGFEALHFLRHANVQPGQKVLVFGAGGSIGTFSIQLAKHFGAEVTAVDSARKLEMLRSIGADKVIDYRKEDFTRNGESYDVIIDVVGKRAFPRRLKSLKPDGYYFLANAGLSHVIRKIWASLTSRRRVVIGSSSQTREDLNHLKDLIEKGKIRTIIDKSYPLAQMAEAHRYAETGVKLGNIAISVASGN